MQTVRGGEGLGHRVRHGRRRSGRRGLRRQDDRSEGEGRSRPCRHEEAERVEKEEGESKGGEGWDGTQSPLWRCVGSPGYQVEMVALYLHDIVHVEQAIMY